MSQLKEHSILAAPSQSAIEDFYYHIDRETPSKSFIDMALRKGKEIVELRFYRPIDLKIEIGFPATPGMVFYDVSAHGAENIGVEVASVGTSPGSITFCAKSVERI